MVKKSYLFSLWKTISDVKVSTAFLIKVSTHSGSIFSTGFLRCSFKKIHFGSEFLINDLKRNANAFSRMSARK